VLYALSEWGAMADKGPIRRACSYLIESQTPEGYWSVPSRAISSASNQGRLERLTPIYRYWGTGWASIGLSHSLGDAEGH
jgi:hypothetical protein